MFLDYKNRRYLETNKRDIKIRLKEASLILISNKDLSK